jgi:hypothetical protein
VVIDAVWKADGFEDDCRASGTAAALLTVGGVAAQYFQNDPERALRILTGRGSGPGLSLSRFNRRLHARRDWLPGLLSLVADRDAPGEAFILDRMPLPVGKRARASRGKTGRGQALGG